MLLINGRIDDNSRYFMSCAFGKMQEFGIRITFGSPVVPEVWTTQKIDLYKVEGELYSWLFQIVIDLLSQQLRGIFFSTENCGIGVSDKDMIQLIFSRLIEVFFVCSSFKTMNVCCNSFSLKRKGIFK